MAAAVQNACTKACIAHSAKSKKQALQVFKHSRKNSTRRVLFALLGRRPRPLEKC